MKYLLGLVPLLALIGCTHSGIQHETATVTGKAIYLDRAAAPPDARLEVILEDISRADAPAKRIGEAIFHDAGQPPYSFVIEYDVNEIDPRHTYRLAARLYDGEDLLFVTDEVHQVITRGFPAEATLRLRRVESAGTNLLGAVPATFKGTIPCADCPGIDIQINFLTDGVYFMSESYQDRDGGPFFDRGRYLISSDGKIVSLHGGKEAPKRFEILSTDTLKMMDLGGQSIESELNYSIFREPEFQPMNSRGLIGGMYRYFAGAGRFRECLTGLEMPVVSEGDNRALEEAYLEVRKEPGEELKVSLEGQIVHRMPVEGPGPVRMLVPDRFIGVWPGQTCPSPVHQVELHHTYWRLTSLDGEYPRRVPNQREPHLVFREDGRVTGSDGCNRLIGVFELDNSSMDISQLATTRKACLEGMGEAKRFAELLDEISRYRIIGQHLEMLDSSGTLRLFFEAVALH